MRATVLVRGDVVGLLDRELVEHALREVWWAVLAATDRDEADHGLRRVGRALVVIVAAGGCWHPQWPTCVS